MKILSAAQIRQADQYTIAHQPISSHALMERAASACTDYILASARPSDHYIVVCGSGNNGGDGLAIARMLGHASRMVAVYIPEYTNQASSDFLNNLELLRAVPSVSVHHFTLAEEFDIRRDADTVIIDAIFGSGTNRPAESLIADLIELINATGCRVISIDVPSGLSADGPVLREWPVVRATVTLTFQQPKLSFLFAEGGAYVGQMKILDIGIDKDYTESLNSQYYFLQQKDISPLLLSRERFANKGTFGHSLLIAGSYGKIGAAVLSSHACLRSGTGLLTTHTPACGYQVLQTSLPEAMASADTHAEHITMLPTLEPYSSIGIGPGIDKHPDTAKVVKWLIQSAACPLVLDADALNIISENKTWLGFLPPRSILTPHPKEFDRLTENHSDSMERLRTAQALAHKHSIIIVLKGAYTATIMPDRTVWFNSTGNPGLAKGGTGDILTGIITALISRGYQASDAAFLGVYLHGLAADLAISDIHPESLLASDVVAYISAAFEYLYRE